MGLLSTALRIGGTLLGNAIAPGIGGTIGGTLGGMAGGAIEGEDKPKGASGGTGGGLAKSSKDYELQPSPIFKPRAPTTTPSNNQSQLSFNNDTAKFGEASKETLFWQQMAAKAAQMSKIEG